jgi:hypothetical protein
MILVKMSAGCCFVATRRGAAGGASRGGGRGRRKLYDFHVLSVAKLPMDGAARAGWPLAPCGAAKAASHDPPKLAVGLRRSASFGVGIRSCTADLSPSRAAAAAAALLATWAAWALPRDDHSHISGSTNPLTRTQQAQPSWPGATSSRAPLVTIQVYLARGLLESQCMACGDPGVPRLRHRDQWRSSTAVTIRSLKALMMVTWACSNHNV